MFIASALALANSYIPIYVFVCVCVCVCIYVYIYIYQNHHKLCTPLDLAVKKKKTEATAVLRAHGALHSRHFAAKKGMADEVAAGIAAGQDVNAKPKPMRSFFCVCVCVCVCGWRLVAGLVCKSLMYALLVKHSLDQQTMSYTSNTYFYVCVCVCSQQDEALIRIY